MGAACSSDKVTVSNCEKCDEDEKDEEECQAEGNVYMVIAGCSYTSPACHQIGWGPIDQYKSAQFMQRIAENSEVGDFKTVMQDEMTKDNILNAIEEMGQQCEDGDYFIFYYAGHGDQMADQDGDEDEGKDEALVCLNPETLTPEPRDDSVWLRDDVLVEAITSNVTKGAKILFLADCCHSGGILDLSKPQWKGFKAVSISGCASKEVSKGLGKGSFFSHSLSAAFEVLQSEGKSAYMISEVFNNMLNQFEERYSQYSDQTLTLMSRGVEAKDFPWPLVPTVSVVAEGKTGGVINYGAPP